MMRMRLPLHYTDPKERGGGGVRWEWDGSGCGGSRVVSCLPSKKMYIYQVN